MQQQYLQIYRMLHYLKNTSQVSFPKLLRV
nr:MAG TPA: hypothetical protein [Caudoviricetes sp.]